MKDLIDLVDGKKTRRRIPSSRRKIIYKRDFKRCRYCKKRVDYRTFHADHIKPVSYGGNDYVFNLATSCPDCNMSRSNKVWIRPKKLSFIQEVYEKFLIVWYLDIPSVKDFI